MKISKFRKTASILLALAVVFLTLASGCAKKDELITIRLNEVAHSVFYAPQYVAMEKGFFAEEGLAIDLATGQGADKSMTALISNSADIGLMGTEASIYVYNEGKENYIKCFAQLTQRAGNFLVSREQYDNFTWDDVRGKEVIGGRVGGMPQLVLEYVLEMNDILPGRDVEIINNIQYNSTAGAFAGGVGDFTAEFEPTASTLEDEGQGYVVSSLGEGSGYLPYTVYMATKEYISKNPTAIQKFTDAIYRGQLWVDSHTSREIAEVIQPHFKESDIDQLERIVERYKKQDTYRTTPVFDSEGFDLFQDIMEAGGQLDKRVSFGELIDNTFAEKAEKNAK